MESTKIQFVLQRKRYKKEEINIFVINVKIEADAQNTSKFAIQ